MLKKLKSRTKIALIVSLIITFGLSFRIGLDKFFIEETNQAITPPIDAKDEANRLIQTASQNFFYHEFDQAVENYKKAISLFEERKDFKRAARTYESIGDIHKFSRNSKEAKNAYLLAVEYHQKLQDKIGKGRAMKKIAELHMDYSELDKAGEWFGKAVMEVKDAKPHIVKAKIFETQGHYFLKTEQISKALEAFQQAKSDFDKAGYPLGYDNISPMIQKLKRQLKNNTT
ncbi:uncharacterized protein METZ01_LOCUS214538 [marine metagenome]|uniref:Uncharacterized protein n=1 Tax=marine metagenome TaxID=408172 RepID=A0A382FH71_9ZZZZ